MSAPEHTAALDIRGLSKAYRIGHVRRTRKPALVDLTLSVSAGEVFGYLGPNGSGKTTTLKILTGLVFPDAGSAKSLGSPLGDRAGRQRLGFLPENPNFYDYLTPREYLDYAGRLFGLDKPQRQGRARELLEKVGLTGFADVALRRFSKGMLQRMGLAQALVNSPDLVFLDEPMSGLDPIGRRLVREMILDLKAAGKTVFFSTHILSDAETLCDRVALMRAGRLVAVGRLSDILHIDVTHMEILVTGIPESALDSLPPGSEKRRTMGERWTLNVPEAQLGAVVQALEKAGGRILSVQPVRQSLEEYFFKEMDADTVGPRGLSRILAVAANTFRETIRERVLYNLLFFAIVMTVSGLLLGQISIRQDEKIIKDIALAAMDFFGTAIAVFVGVGLVSKEIERRSLYPLMAKPVTRDEFLLGKFAGLSFTLLVNVTVMTAGLYLTLFLTGRPLDLRLLAAVFPIFLSLVLTVAVVLLFSILFTSTALAAFASLILVVGGRFSDVIRNMREVAPGAPAWLIQGLYYALPNYRNFDFKDRVVYGDPISTADLGWVTAYAAVYVAIVLGIALAAFRRREFV